MILSLVCGLGTRASPPAQGTGPRDNMHPALHAQSTYLTCALCLPRVRERTVKSTQGWPAATSKGTNTAACRKEDDLMQLQAIGAESLAATRFRLLSQRKAHPCSIATEQFRTVADRVISRSASPFTAKRFDPHCSPFTAKRFDPLFTVHRSPFTAVVTKTRDGTGQRRPFPSRVLKYGTAACA